jgi:hypothetical protein
MMPAGTLIGRMRSAVDQLLKDTAELREHLHEGTNLHLAVRLQVPSTGNASPTAAPEATRAERTRTTSSSG